MAGNWRWMTGSPIAPALLLLLTPLLLPESPRWLLVRGDMSGAHSALLRVHHTSVRSLLARTTIVMGCGH
jgi:Sugar (and other) transporter